MLRLPLIVRAIAVVTLLLPGAGAQSKDRAKEKITPKICKHNAGSQAALRDGCVLPKAFNSPTQLRIGGSSFGAGGSTTTGGSTSNVPSLRNPGPSLNQPHFAPRPRR